MKGAGRRISLTVWTVCGRFNEPTVQSYPVDSPTVSEVLDSLDSSPPLFEREKRKREERAGPSKLSKPSTPTSTTVITDLRHSLGIARRSVGQRVEG
jgi:hypothetical protein